MTELVVAHTADLEKPTLAAARALLHAVFEGNFDDHDWEHALGGMHALVWHADELIGHASVIQRRLVHDGRALRAGYVEGVGVRSDHRRHGHATRMMEAVERVIRRAYDLGALGATDDAVPLYVGRGWKLWEGPLSALTPSGVRPTPKDGGCVYVLPANAALDLAGELTADWRDGDVW
jgi:aminoglycoside 2'-N-acetyltransferase I